MREAGGSVEAFITLSELAWRQWLLGSTGAACGFLEAWGSGRAGTGAEVDADIWEEGRLLELLDPDARVLKRSRFGEQLSDGAVQIQRDVVETLTRD